MLSQVVRNVERLSCLTLDKDLLEVNLLGASNYFLQLLAGELDLAVTQLVLRRGLRLELLFDYAVVSLLFASSHAVQVRRCGLVLADRLLHVERIDILHKLEPGFGRSCVHAQIEVIFDLFECHWGRPLRLLDLRRDSSVLLAVQTLVLDQVVESSVIGPDTQVLLDVFLLLVQLVLVEPVQHFVGPCALLLRQAIDLGLSSLLVGDIVPRGIEVLGLGGWASQNPALHTEPV